MGLETPQLPISGLIRRTAFALAALWALSIGLYSWAAISPTVAYPITFVSSIFLVAGLWAWLRKRNRTLGFLVALTGVAIACTALSTSQNQPAFLIGVGLLYLPLALVGHLLMVFPSGQFEARYQRSLVAIGYFDALLLAVPFVLLFDFQALCPNCEPSPLGPTASPAAFELLALLRLFLAAVMTTGLAIALTQRWIAATPSTRHQMAPVIGAGGVVLAAFALAFFGFAANGPSSERELATVAIMLLAGLIPFSLCIALRQRGFDRDLALEDLSSKLAAQRADQVDLRALLAELLGDPSVEIVYWLQSKNEYVTEQGLPYEEDLVSASSTVHPIGDSNERIGAVVYSSIAADRSELLGAAEYDIGVAMRDSRIEADLRANIAEISSSRLRLLATADEKQRRIERDLHDGAQQGIVSIALDLALTANDPVIDERPRAAMLRSAALLTNLTEELRELARGIHPAILTDGGLDGAIKSLADRCPIPTKIRGSCDGSLPRSVESAAYFVVAEALTNVARSSGAEFVDISVLRTDSKITLTVRDDGRGGADPSKGTGLRGLADRVAAVGGELAITSRHGDGTSIFVELPVLREPRDQVGESSGLQAAVAAGNRVMC